MLFVSESSACITHMFIVGITTEECYEKKRRTLLLLDVTKETIHIRNSCMKKERPIRLRCTTFSLTYNASRYLPFLSTSLKSYKTKKTAYLYKTNMSLHRNCDLQAFEKERSMSNGLQFKTINTIPMACAPQTAQLARVWINEQGLFV
jgi:hypothetical protein